MLPSQSRLCCSSAALLAGTPPPPVRPRDANAVRPWPSPQRVPGGEDFACAGAFGPAERGPLLPFYPMHRGLSDVLQELTFVLLALVGLRWSFEDHEQRCKDCLRSLASPERVGRPSHNLLEWSGTKQICLLGHGALSSPEMISSWCERSRWSERPAGLDPAIAG